jgi:hypothetical protein
VECKGQQGRKRNKTHGEPRQAPEDLYTIKQEDGEDATPSLPLPQPHPNAAHKRNKTHGEPRQAPEDLYTIKEEAEE